MTEPTAPDYPPAGVDQRTLDRLLYLARDCANRLHPLEHARREDLCRARGDWSVLWVHAGDEVVAEWPPGERLVGVDIETYAALLADPELVIELEIEPLAPDDLSSLDEDPLG